MSIKSRMELPVTMEELRRERAVEEPEVPAISEYSVRGGNIKELAAVIEKEVGNLYKYGVWREDADYFIQVWALKFFYPHDWLKIVGKMD